MASRRGVGIFDKSSYEKEAVHVALVSQLTSTWPHGKLTKFSNIGGVDGSFQTFEIGWVVLVAICIVDSFA